MLFDWYMDGDTPSQLFDGFKLSEPSARFFDQVAARVGAAVAGRTTYEHSGHWGGRGPHPTAPLFVVGHGPVPSVSEPQTLVSTGIEDAVAAARKAAGDLDVALMGGGVLTSALEAGLVDEVILHRVPVLLGGGRGYFHEFPAHVRLRLLEARSDHCRAAERIGHDQNRCHHGVRRRSGNGPGHSPLGQGRPVRGPDQHVGQRFSRRHP